MKRLKKTKILIKDKNLLEKSFEKFIFANGENR